MPPPPPQLMEELVEEVLLRFPPDDPASLVRAALVCKLWRRIVSGAVFRRRFHKFHQGAAPLLGVLYNTGDDDDDDDIDDILPRDTDDTFLREPPTAYFALTTSFRPPAHAATGRRGWRAIDAHHGRVLLCRSQSDPSCRDLALSVWDPVTDEQRDLPELEFPFSTIGYSAAVACAATATAGGNCDHLDCRRGPFLVVVIDVQAHVILLAVYSSEAGAWTQSDFDNLGTTSRGTMEHTPGVLVGTALYFLVHFGNEIVEYDMATQAVHLIDLPYGFRHLLEQRSIVLVTDGDGGLGFVAHREYKLELWSMVDGEHAGFVLKRVIDLQKVLPSAGTLINSSLRVKGFVESGASRVLFMKSSDELYSMEMNSGHVRKLANCCGDDEDEDNVVPYTSFCTPISTCERPRSGSASGPRTQVVALAQGSSKLKSDF